MYKISKLKFDILQNVCAYNRLGHAGSENVKHLSKWSKYLVFFFFSFLMQNLAV